MRIWISATCLSKSLAMNDWPSNFIQCIFVSTRLRRWYPLQRRHTVRPRYRCALTALLRAIAPALVHCPAVAACSNERGLPGLGILAWRDHRMGISGGNRLVAFTGVVRPVHCPAGDCKAICREGAVTLPMS